MTRASSFLGLVLLGLTLVSAQTPVKGKRENHPKLTTFECTKRGGCKAQTSYIVLDSLAHHVHQKDAPEKGCGNWGEAPPADVCPDEKTCAKNCVLEPLEDYSQNGIYTDGTSLTLRQLREDGQLVSPRVYLLEKNKQNYEMLKLTGREFTFDVDVSKLPCGMNGALYLSEMDKKGGRHPLNKAGAYYGSGYCDAQCYTTPFINGVANIEGKGSCCNEMDIWEANGRATHLAPHPCSVKGLYKCTGEECAYEGVCDKPGCGYNPNRVNQWDYYGPGKVVDTRKPFTVVTQFIANKKGKLSEIHRLYVQNGRIIENASVNITSLPQIDYMNDEFCEATNARRFMELGAMEEMGDALTRGMVLAMSVWWDEGGHMQWLDGNEAGPCTFEESDPEYIKQIQPDTEVIFKNIKWGEIGSTFKAKSRW